MRYTNLISLLGLIIGTSVPFSVLAQTPAAAPAVAPSNALKLNVSLVGGTYKTPSLNSTTFGPSLQMIYVHGFNAYADSRVDVSMDALTGATSGLMPVDLMAQAGPRQLLRLREAVVDLHSESRVYSLRIGAVNQREFKNPLLLGDLAFMGALAEAKGRTAVGELSLKVERAVPPTSFSRLETASGDGPTPAYTAAQVSDVVGDVDRTFVGFTAGAFQFDNLTTAQARQSLYWGNTVTGTTNSAKFYLPYRGYEGGARAGLGLGTRWQALFDTNVLQNAAAPGGAGFGSLTTVGAKYALDRGSVLAHVGYVYDQSDSGPATFSDFFLNSKNHRGILIDVTYDAGSYSVFARGLKTQGLVPQLYTGDNVAVIIGVQVRYDLF